MHFLFKIKQIIDPWLKSEIRRYLREIETNETQYLGGLLREIYEQRLQDVFQVELEIEVERHDATIESICHHHYSKESDFTFFFNFSKIQPNLKFLYKCEYFEFCPRNRLKS